MVFQTRIALPTTTFDRVMITSDYDFATDRQYMFVRSDSREGLRSWLVNFRKSIDEVIKDIEEYDRASSDQ